MRSTSTDSLVKETSTSPLRRLDKLDLQIISVFKFAHWTYAACTCILYAMRKLQLIQSLVEKIYPSYGLLEW